MIKIDNKKAQLLKSVDFYAVLNNFAFLTEIIKEKNLDIEGMSVSGNSLLIAFKDPLFNKKPLILKINNFMNIFNIKKLSSSDVTFSTVDDVPENERISDIYTDTDKFYFTTSCNKGKCGGFYELKDDKAVLIKRFDTLKPEGIAFDTYFCIFFDEGGDRNSRFMEIKR